MGKDGAGGWLYVSVGGMEICSDGELVFCWIGSGGVKMIHHSSPRHRMRVETPSQNASHGTYMSEPNTEPYLTLFTYPHL